MEFLRVVGQCRWILLAVPSSSSALISIVEYATREEAQRSIRELAEMPLLGRPVFIREVRGSTRPEIHPHAYCRIVNPSHASGPLPSRGR